MALNSNQSGLLIPHICATIVPIHHTGSLVTSVDCNFNFNFREDEYRQGFLYKKESRLSLLIISFFFNHWHPKEEQNGFELGSGQERELSPNP